MDPVRGTTPPAPSCRLMQGSGQPPASDPELALSRVAGVMRTFFARLSDPAMLPELPKLQARPAARPPAPACAVCCAVLLWQALTAAGAHAAARRRVLRLRLRSTETRAAPCLACQRIAPIPTWGRLQRASRQG